MVVNQAVNTSEDQALFTGLVIVHNNLVYAYI